MFENEAMRPASRILLVATTALAFGCSGSSPGNAGGGATNGGTGAAIGTGGAVAAGGSIFSGGTTSAGGLSSTGGQAPTGGSMATGGAISGGGSTATGGQTPASTGGSKASGGANTGGTATGGASTGGSSSGGKATGGTANGGTSSGGQSATGGATMNTGGLTGTGGAAGTCPGGGWAPGKQTINTTWGGVARQYVVYIPKNYTGTSPVALTMVIHGAHNTPALAESWSQMDPISEQNGFIVVYPAGLDCWKVGTTTLPGCTTADDDVGFLNNVVTEVESHACIDKKRVYVTGISNGSMMTQYMGCHFADIYAAAGGVAAGGGCAPSRPLPFFYVLGTSDEIVGWDNGANALNWAKRNNCNTTTPVTVYDQGGNTCIVYQGCSAGVEVEFCTVTGMPHCWPDNCYQASSGYTPFKVSPLMWQFFSRYSLP
jgi:poly(3-hydroxybutyrate) depolymerase